MDKAARETLAERVLTLGGTGPLEAIVSDRQSGLTRFTQNAIHQNLAARDTSVRVRAIVDHRTGVAVTNDLSDASLTATIARAKEMAGFAPSDDAAPGLARSASSPTLSGAYVAATADASPADRARIAADLIATAESAGLWAAGYVTTERSGLTIANSAGTLASFDGTECGLNVKANGPDASGFAEFYGNDIAGLDGSASGAIAAAKARLGKNPVAVDPGPWTVILEPAAFGELLAYLTDSFSAQAFDEGSSCFSDGLERRYAGPNVTLTDDFAHPLFCGRSFDYEGYPSARLPLLENGIAKNIVTDANWAKRLNRPNTGHGFPAPSAAGPEPMHPVISAGEKTVDQLIAETPRGLLITRFWYIRPVDQRRTIVTGMTRDGTFEIQNGELTRGVKNLRFNQSILEALTRVEFASTQTRTGGYAYQSIVPAAKVEAFHFTSTTDF